MTGLDERASPTIGSRRVEHIDGLRGLAALLVVFSHVLEQAWVLVPGLGFPLNHPLLDVLGLGRIGVVAFFCVSGFVIPFSFKAPSAQRRFLTTRFFRLYPAYWVSLAVFLAVSAWAEGGLAFSWRQIAANATMVQALFRQADVVSVYWTLFYELVFYACCMLAYQAGWLRSVRSVVTLLVTLAALACLAALLRFARFPVSLPLGIPTYLAIMFFGTFWRYVTLNQDPLAIAWRGRVLALVVAMIGVVALFGYWHGPLPERPAADLLGVYVGLGLFLMAFSFRRTFARPLMQWLGSISYSLYLFHPACVLVIMVAARQLESPLLRLVVLLVSIPLSILVAHISAKLVEKPMIDLGHRISRRMGTLSAPAPSSP